MQPKKPFALYPHHGDYVLALILTPPKTNTFTPSGLLAGHRRFRVRALGRLPDFASCALSSRSMLWEIMRARLTQSTAALVQYPSVSCDWIVAPLLLPAPICLCILALQVWYSVPTTP